MKTRAAAVAAVCFVLFNANGREIGSYDSQPSRALAVTMVKYHVLTLDAAVAASPGLADRPGFARDKTGHYRSGYPLPSAFAAAATAWLLSSLRLLDLSSPLASSLVAKLTASALTSLAAAFACLAAGRRTTARRAVVIALAFAVGTNLWAIVSQTLWQQETSLAAVMAAIWLMGWRDGTPGMAFLAGTALGVAGWARPQLAPLLIVLACSLPLRWGRRGLVAWIPLATLAAVAVSINELWFGQLLGAALTREALNPSVHGVAGTLGTQPWLAAGGLLVSPSRGLLIFSPVVLASVSGWKAVRDEGWRSDLSWGVLAAAVQLAAYALYSVWWSGHTYGPRYALDLLPPLVPVAAAGMPCLMARRSRQGLAAAALAWSIGVAALGAFDYPNDRWNTDPRDVDRSHERLWEWGDSQVVRALHARPSSQNYAFLRPGMLRRSSNSR